MNLDEMKKQAVDRVVNPPIFFGSKSTEPYVQGYSLAYKAYVPTYCGTVVPTGYAIPKKKEKTMRYDSAAANVAVNLQANANFSKEKTAQEYLIVRLQEVAYKKRDDQALQAKFNLLEGKFKTAREMVQAIKDGKITFTYETDEEELEDYGNSFRRPSELVYSITFRDPKAKADRHGWKAVVEQIEKDAKAVKDIIMVSSAEEGLKALQAFEAKDYTK